MSDKKLAIFLSMLSVTWGCNFSHPVEYHLPSKFEGKAIVIFEVADGEDALNSEGELIIHFDSTGIARIQQKTNTGLNLADARKILMHSKNRFDTVRFFYTNEFMNDTNISMDSFVACCLENGSGLTNDTKQTVIYESFLIFRKRNYDSIRAYTEYIFEPDYR